MCKIRRTKSPRGAACWCAAAVQLACKDPPWAGWGLWLSVQFQVALNTAETQSLDVGCAALSPQPQLCCCAAVQCELCGCGQLSCRVAPGLRGLTASPAPCEASESLFAPPFLKNYLFIVGLAFQRELGNLSLLGFSCSLFQIKLSAVVCICCTDQRILICGGCFFIRCFSQECPWYFSQGRECSLKKQVL